MHNRGPLVHGRAVYINRADERDLVRMTLSEDAGTVSTEVLVEGIELPGGSWFRAAWRPTSLLVLRDDGDLLDVDLERGELELVRDGVRDFSMSDDQRWVIWSQGDPAQETAPRPQEKWLLDRQAGVPERIAFDGGAEIFGQIIGQHLMAHALEEDGGTRATLFRWLPGGQTTQIDGRWFPFGRHASGAFGAIEMSLAPETGIDVWVPEDGSLKRVAGPIESNRAGPEGLWVHEEASDETIDPEGGVCSYDLVLYSFETLQLEVVEEGICAGVAVGDGRWIQVAGASHETHWLGDLRVIDGATGAARTVDRSVFWDFEHHEPHEPIAPRPWRSDEIVYQVRDSGARTGLWRARFGS
jgi:hypothetical protein